MDTRQLRGIVAGNVRRAANEKGITLNSLADFAGVSRSQLYDVLSSKKGATLDWLSKIAAALEVAPWRLLVPAGRKE